MRNSHSEDNDGTVENRDVNMVVNRFYTPRNGNERRLET